MKHYAFNANLIEVKSTMAFHFPHNKQTVHALHFIVFFVLSKNPMTNPQAYFRIQY